MRINYINDQPIDRSISPMMFVNKLLIFTPIIAFVGLLVYHYRYFGKRIGLGIIVTNLGLFVIHRELLVQNFGFLSLEVSVKAMFILDAILLTGLALIYLELSQKQILYGMGILNGILVVMNSSSYFPRSPAIYIAIFLISVMFVAGVSMIVDRYLLDKARDNPTNVLIITFGIALLIQSVIPILKFPDGENFSRFDIIQRNLEGIVLKTETVTYFGVAVQMLRVIAAGLSIIFLILIYLFINKTPMGRAMEAVSEDPEAAWLVGINVRKVYLIATGLGMGLAAAAAILVTPFVAQPFWGVYMGWAPLIFAIAVVTLGGLGSIFGSAVAGFIIGFAEATIAYEDIALSRIVPLIAIFLIMLVRPNGLFGSEEDEE